MAEQSTPYTDVASERMFTQLVEDEDRPVVIDFWAPWCGPCKKMAPAFEAVAGEYQERALFLKVDTQAQPKLGTAFGVRSIPTLIVLYQGEIFDIRVGAATQPHLASMVQRAVDKSEGVGIVGKVKRMFGG